MEKDAYGKPLNIHICMYMHAYIIYIHTHTHTYVHINALNKMALIIIPCMTMPNN